MKKLMTVLASAATALFAFGVAKGDGFTNKAGFESYQAGQKLDLTLNDSGENASPRYWYTSSAEDAGDISNHVGEAIAKALIPDGFESEGSKYLHIDTSAPLFRHVSAETEGATATPVAIGDGIYLDTLVQFTAADDEFQDGSLQDGDKIAISYVEHEDDATTEEVNEAWTNFVIRAGYIGTSEITQKNYKAKLPDGAVFNKDGWHRLTVRTVPNIDTKGNVGFVVYVDQVALVYADDHETIGIDVELAGVAATVPTSVFPSAVAASGTGGSTISAASFSGTGAIDDVVFTKDTPNFIKENSLVRIAITLGTGVTGVTVTTNSVAVDADATSTEATKVFLLAPETASFGLTGIYETGYSNFAVVFAEGDTTSRFDDGTVTFEGASLAFTVKASRNNFNVFAANGDAISGTYETLTQALAAEGVAKIQLAYDYVVPAEEIPENAAVFEIGKNDEIVLDLNGKTLNGGGSDSDEMFYVEGVLTVIDSSSANTGKIIYTGKAGVFAADSNAELYIGAAEGDYGPKIDGLLFVANSEGLVVNAKVLASANTAESAFVWADFVARGSTLKAAQVDGYWVVAPSDQPEPKTYALTLPTVANASAVVTAGGTAVADLTAIAENTQVLVTWTAADGYKITVGATETITMTENKTAASPTVAEIKYATLTITAVENCTIVVSNATEEVASGAKFDVDDSVTLTVYRTPAEGYKLANGCAATEEIVMSEDRLVTAAVEQDDEKTYPSYIGADTEKKAKYDAWAKANDIAATDFPDAEGKNKDAYLLNCAPTSVDTEKAAFKFTKIAFEDGVWVTETTTKNTADYDYNGEVVVTRYSDVGCTEKSETGSFFKAELK